MLWNIEPWEIPAMLMTVGKIIAWGIILYGLKWAVEILAWQVPEDADITEGTRQVTDEWLRVRPPQNVRRRPHWKYIGLWLNNLPGSILLAYAVRERYWWLLPLVVANWWWAGREFSRQVAMDQAQKWEDEHAGEL